MTVGRKFGSKSSALHAGPHGPALAPHTEYEFRASSPGPPTILSHTELAKEWEWNGLGGNF